MNPCGSVNYVSTCHINLKYSLGKARKDTKHVEVNDKNTRNMAMQHRAKSRISQGSGPDLSASNIAGAMRKVQRQQPQNVRQWRNKIANFQPNRLNPKSSITDPAVINFRRNNKAVDPKKSMAFNLGKKHDIIATGVAIFW